MCGFLFCVFRNFAKFLCDSNGIPIKRYAPNENPLSFEQDLVSVFASAAGMGGSEGDEAHRSQGEL